MINQPTNIIGKVILAAAGCGDPELITVKVAKYLQQADVVLTDRLVSEQIINAYVKKSSEVVYVGKQHNNAASVSQQLINELIVKYAKQNKLVVRLKGGDVAFFSNVLDELETLIANQIPFEIVPGITAASGAAAYTGIPLTARGYSTSVRMLTYYKQTIFSESLWAELAATDDTLVFYMSSENVTAIVNFLTKNGIANDKLLAIIQQATTPSQKVKVYNLYSFNTLGQAPILASPTLLIIGRVVALHHTFNWQNNSNENIAYFKQIETETA